MNTQTRREAAHARTDAPPAPIARPGAGGAASAISPLVSGGELQAAPSSPPVAPAVRPHTVAAGAQAAGPDAASGKASGPAPTVTTLVHDRATDLASTGEGRRLVAEYLARLDLNGYRRGAMADYINTTLAAVTALPPLKAEACFEELKAAVLIRQQTGDRDHTQAEWNTACAAVDAALHHLCVDREGGLERG